MKQGEKMLKKLTQQATDLILHSIASGEVMGANLLITKGNEELVYAQAGMADREAEKPIERNTIFRLYSMTKPVTAVAASGSFPEQDEGSQKFKGRSFLIAVSYGTLIFCHI